MKLMSKRRRKKIGGIKLPKIKEALAEKKVIWHQSNKVLYDLCNKHRGHNNIQGTIAKLLIIGRVYAAEIERNHNNTPREKLYKNLALKLKRGGFDKQLAGVKRSIKNIDRINNSNLKKVLAVHKWLMNQIHNSGGPKEAISFASKYLHFHLPNVYFMYDSRAPKGFRTIPVDKKLKQNLDEWKKCDAKYGKWFCKLLALRKHIRKKFYKRLSPRNIDRLLLNRYERDSKNTGKTHR